MNLKNMKFFITILLFLLNVNSTILADGNVKPLNAFNHTSGVIDFAFGVDGKIVTASNCKAKLWSLIHSNEPLKIFDHKRTINGIDISPDGRVIVTVSGNSIKTWKSYYPQHPFHSDNDDPRSFPDYGVQFLKSKLNQDIEKYTFITAWYHGLNTHLTGPQPYLNGPSLDNTHKERDIDFLAGRSDNVRTFTISENMEYIAAIVNKSLHIVKTSPHSGDNGLLPKRDFSLYSIASPDDIFDSNLYDIEFGPNSGSILIGTKHYGAVLYRINELHHLMHKVNKDKFDRKNAKAFFKSDGSGICTIDFHSSGKYILTGSIGGEVKLWNVNKPSNAIAVIEHDDGFNCNLTFSPNGNYFLTGSDPDKNSKYGKAKLWLLDQFL